MSPSTRSTFADYLGLGRSWIVYNGRPFRIRRLAAFYRQFVQASDLCFDIGAHVGTHTKAFRRLSARVVALEPQPLFFQYLHKKFQRDSRVMLLNAAAGPKLGRRSMQISRRTPTVSTLSTEWIEVVKENPSFQTVSWDHRIEVDLVTLDSLIEKHGLPFFCKIDVEGYEPEVLVGLSYQIPVLSFEHTSSTQDGLQASLDQLSRLGGYEYNWSVAEQMRLQNPTWLDERSLVERLHIRSTNAPSVDIIARSQEA